MKLKKLVIMFTCVASMALVASACSNSKKAETTTENKDSSKTDSSAAESSSAAVIEETEALTKPENYGEVKLGNYKGIKVAVADTTVTDAEIDAQINNILKSYPEKEEITDRPAEKGDTVNIDFVGTENGVEFDGGQAKGHDLELGSNSFINGFEDGLIGVKKGDVKDLNLKFPDDYHDANHAGKDVTFKVTVNGIYKKKDAELTDEWVSKTTGGKQKTVSEYKQFLKDSLAKSKQFSSDQQAQQQVLNSVIEASEFKPSQEALDYEFKNIVNQYKAMANSTNQKYEDYIKSNNMTVEDFEKELKSYAEEMVKSELVFNGIFKQENMKIEDKDYDILTTQYGQDKDTLIANYGKDIVERQVKILKVLNFLLDNADKTVQDTTQAAPTTAPEANSGQTHEETSSVAAPDTESSSAQN